MPDILTAPGSRIFKANVYYTKLMKLSQKLSEVAKVTVRMELNGACIEENHVFTNVIDKCGDELLDIGQHLKQLALDIQKARQDYLEEQRRRLAHKHSYELPKCPTHA